MLDVSEGQTRSGDGHQFPFMPSAPHIDRDKMLATDAFLYVKAKLIFSLG